MDGVTLCAVKGCGLPIFKTSNLCVKHRVPGGVVLTGKSSMVITSWRVKHGDEIGIIFLNDWALGNLFGGQEGFEAKLKRQGFSEVKNLRTLQELEAAERPANGGKLARWSGPWLTSYPWEAS